MNRAIGGYFELELPKPKPFLYAMAHEFQSARAAFLALLRVGRPTRVFMPRFICDSMIAPLEKSGTACSFYSIDENFDIVDDFDFSETDWIFYVDYFGVCNKNVERLLAKFNSQQVILDHSQAFYAKPRNCLATIYSPRKFFGVPDGGLLVTELPICEPELSDQGSLGRAAYGLTRLAATPEAGYAEYQRAELSLDEFEPSKMSQLSRHILHSICLDAARLRRNENFHFLHQRLGGSNKLPLGLTDVDGPLCYPFLTMTTGLRTHLIEARVFVASYWAEVKGRAGELSCELQFVQNLLPLPCDQRYGIEDMERIAGICLDFMRDNESA